MIPDPTAPRTTEPTTAELREQIRVVYSMPHRAPRDVVGPRVEAGDVLRLLDDYNALTDRVGQPVAQDEVARLREALEKQGLLLDCLETVCVGLPTADREAAMDFIEQIAASRRAALSGEAEG